MCNPSLGLAVKQPHVLGRGSRSRSELDFMRRRIDVNPDVPDWTLRVTRINQDKPIILHVVRPLRRSGSRTHILSQLIVHVPRVGRKLAGTRDVRIRLMSALCPSVS